MRRGFLGKLPQQFDTDIRTNPNMAESGVTDEKEEKKSKTNQHMSGSGSTLNNDKSKSF